MSPPSRNPHSFLFVAPDHPRIDGRLAATAAITSLPMALSSIAAAATVAQPQAHQEALALGLGPVGEACARMAGRPVVDDLNLARLKIQIHPQLRAIEDRFDGLERGRRLAVHALAAQLVPGDDLSHREACV